MNPNITHLPRTQAQIDAYPIHLHWRIVAMQERVDWLQRLLDLQARLERSKHPGAASGLAVIDIVYNTMAQTHPFSVN
ncbi:MAG: hypothetical protein ACO24O_07205 [Arenimonas sp.]